MRRSERFSGSTWKRFPGDRGTARFDFAHHDAIDRAVLDQLEDRVNAVIWSNSPVQTRVMSFDAAREAAYGPLWGSTATVRVLSMAGDFPWNSWRHPRGSDRYRLLRIVSEQGSPPAAADQRLPVLLPMPTCGTLTSPCGTAGRLKVTREQVLDRMEGLLTQQKRLSEGLRSWNKNWRRRPVLISPRGR